MRVKLIGFQALDFKPPDGDPVKGTNIFIVYEENGVQGEKAEKKFLHESFEVPTLKPGDLLDLDCNTKGKILGIKVISTNPSSTPGK